MDALVFAAGRGTRLRPHTDETPKPLLEVGGEPLVAHCLRAVVDAGVERIGLVVGYRSELIVDEFGDAFEGVPIVYAHQRDREGLAHAVLRGVDTLGADSLESVLTVNGDNVFDCDLLPLVETHRDPGVDGTVLLDRVSRNEAETAAVCDLAPDGTIRKLESTTADPPETAYIAAGAQTHGSELIDACREIDRGESGEYELADALQSLVDDGKRYVGVESPGWHLNVNTPADLERAREHFRGA
ncbi:sugar phosphate nucleotidyltransferase [Natrononativus amylolyticus]|uniref:sugar phosphate nucleotidyltransferase n=1 Tax=Natrononativus amylolyticus TaxID=2963434 RepID=UPI0020CF3525|nr:sugar phosphate nucleotidyltransferase [Natrononativus amylolyticus]